MLYNSNMLYHKIKGVDMKQTAFTLAEVLITLGIIGVVAAMTLPSLIANHQKQVYVTGLKKALNVTSNMFQKMKADDGVGDFSSTELFMDGVCSFIPSPESGSINANGCEDFYGNPSVFDRIIPKYLKVVKTCEENKCNISYTTSEFTCTGNNNNKKCSLTNKVPNQKISDILAHNWIKINTYKGYYTTDGMIFYILPMYHITTYGAGIFIIVDINGEKGPNELWRDLYIFMYDSKSRLSKGPVDSYAYDESPIEYMMSNGWKMDY